MAPLKVLRCATLAVLLLSGTYAVGQPPTKPTARTDDAYVNVLGEPYRLPADRKAIVLIFVGHDCPISNGFAPEIVRLDKEFSAQGASFCVVYADADLGAEAARKHAKEYGFACPCVLDPKMTLARKIGATVKPEAAVLSQNGELLYCGRIDDRYADFGKRRPEATTRDLKDALTAVLAGKPVAVTRTKAVGCDIDLPADKK